MTKKCIRCGHEPCPLCKEAGINWCDIVLYSPNDDGYVSPEDINEDGSVNWPVLCCGGECHYSDEDLIQ